MCELMNSLCGGIGKGGVGVGNMSNSAFLKGQGERSGRRMKAGPDHGTR